MTDACPGPLIWFDVPPSDRRDRGAVLECARPACDYVIATGSFNDAAHADTPVMREGFDG